MTPRALPLSPLLLLVAGCLGDDGTTPVAFPPEIRAGTVASNPDNVIAAIVTVRVLYADSVAVRYDPSFDRLDAVSAAVAPVDDTVLVPVLGLLPDATYVLQPVAWGTGHVAVGAPLSFSTGTLPDDLPEYVAGGTNPSPGFVAFAAGPYGLVIDNTGRVVWYHRFPLGPGLNFQAQPTGRYVARPPPVGPSDPAPWVEIDLLGRVTRTLPCADGLQPRFHDLLVEPDGSYWVLCDETRTMDLSGFGGRTEAAVTGQVVQHVGATGALLFRWSVFDHFDIGDVDPLDLDGPSVNWTHANALDLDADGNLIVSFRNLSEVAKVDTRTGAVVWRLGGARNEFVFQGVSAPAFARQHGIRVTGPASLLLLDNLGDSRGSSAERYVLDEWARTARLVASYGSIPAVVAQLGGTTQELPGGRVLVSFGNGGRVEEYDAAGNVVWRIERPGYVFRAQRIQSLYHPGVGAAR